MVIRSFYPTGCGLTEILQETTIIRSQREREDGSEVIIFGDYWSVTELNFPRTELLNLVWYPIDDVIIIKDEVINNF